MGSFYSLGDSILYGRAIMKVGDLVRMKAETWAVTRARRARPDSVGDMGMIYEIAGKGIKILMADGAIKLGLTDHWETMLGPKE